jgi:hypothetical protein
VLPSLRPYRTRGDIATWVRDDRSARSSRIGSPATAISPSANSTLYGADADLPVARRMVALARQHGLVLHAHSDPDAIERLFRQDPRLAFSGRIPGSSARSPSARCSPGIATLWCDLAFRSEQGAGGQVPAEWRALFTEFPDRFMVGTDTYTPERWHYIVEHCQRGPARGSPICQRRSPSALPTATPTRCSPQRRRRAANECRRAAPGTRRPGGAAR